jgi:hypothetical protein
MKYLAIPNSTTNWLNKHNDIRAAFAHDICEIFNDKSISKSVLITGPIRATVSPLEILIAWNTEYLNSSGSDDWGLIRLSEPHGLHASNSNQQENILTRELCVIGLRSEDLILPEPYIHRSHNNNFHTCVAGGRDDLRKLSIGYFEGSVEIGNTSRKVIYCIGPIPQSRNLDQAMNIIVNQLKNECPLLKTLVSEIESTIDKSNNYPVIDKNYFSTLRDHTSTSPTEPHDTIIDQSPLPSEIPLQTQYYADILTYDQWISDNSPLSLEQRNILNQSQINTHPLRITGAAGSGKTLLMQLLAIKTLKHNEQSDKSCKVLYIVHNSAMEEMVWKRFDVLKADNYLTQLSKQHITITTLADYSRNMLKTSDIDIPVIDKDAGQTKEFQHLIANESLSNALKNSSITKDKTPLLFQITENTNLFEIFSELLVFEIGIAIKGHGLTHDSKRYIESEKPLSRLHKQLTRDERTVIFDAFTRYHNQVFEEMGVLDSDDLAITLISHLRTPLWDMRRKSDGVDYLFVDETHLFNENERRIFSLITKPPKPNLPIALALDQAQDIQGTTISGFGKLGIEEIKDEQLTKVPRCTPSILKLAFHFLQQTTDLFSPDFPDFTNNTESITSENHPAASPPQIRRGGTGKQLGNYVIKQIQNLRSGTIRKIGVVVYGTLYWDDIRKTLQQSRENFTVLTRRGDFVPENTPIVVLSKPDVIGGQEFDAVIVVGLESGTVPPSVYGADSLAATLEQQSLRSLYLTFTRAKYRLIIINSVMSSISPLLIPAVNAGLLLNPS